MEQFINIVVNISMDNYDSYKELFNYISRADKTLCCQSSIVIFDNNIFFAEYIFRTETYFIIATADVNLFIEIYLNKVYSRCV